MKKFSKYQWLAKMQENKNLYTWLYGVIDCYHHFGKSSLTAFRKTEHVHTLESILGISISNYSPR
jgi:hypothetical protein